MHARHHEHLLVHHGRGRIRITVIQAVSMTTFVLVRVGIIGQLALGLVLPQRLLATAPAMPQEIPAVVYITLIQLLLVLH